MKILKRVLALALVLVMSLSLVACGSSIEGTWSVEEDGVKGSWTFEDEGKGKMSIGGMSVDFTYETDGDELTITTELMGQKSEDTYTYEIDGDTLTLKNDDEKLELTKED